MRQNDYSNSTSVLERKESLFRFLIDFPFYKRKKRLLQQIMGIFLYLIYFISPSFNSEIHSDLILSPRNCLTSVSDEIRSAPAGSFSVEREKCALCFPLVSHLQMFGKISDQDSDESAERKLYLICILYLHIVHDTVEKTLDALHFMAINT